MSRLILASGSPRRIQLLRDAKFEPEIVPAEVEELWCDFLTPTELTLFNAFQKAAAVAIRHPDAVVLGADTLVALGSEVFGKPRDLVKRFRNFEVSLDLGRRKQSKFYGCVNCPGDNSPDSHLN